MSLLSTVQTLLAHNTAQATAFLKRFAVHQTTDKNQTCYILHFKVAKIFLIIFSSTATKVQELYIPHIT